MKVHLLLSAVVCAAASASAQQSGLPVLHPTFTTLGTLTDTVVNWQAAASPNGKLVLYTSMVGDLRLYDVQEKRSTVIAPADMWASWPAWSRNGDAVAFTHDEAGEPSVYTINVDPNTGAARGTPRRVTVNGGVNPSFSPDGKWIAYNRSDDDNNPVTNLLVVPVTGGVPRTLATGPLAMPTQWSPDGRWIYYVVAGPKSAFPDGSSEWDTYRVRVDGSSRERIARAAGTWPGLTNDARFLVTRSGSTIDTLRHAIVADATGKPIATFTSPLGDEVGHWVDGYRFLTVRDEQRRVLRIADINGASSRDIPTAGTAVATARFSPDGSRIALFQRNGSQTTLVVMNADGTGRHVAPLRNLMGDAQPKWSPDGRYIAYVASRDLPRTINVYDVTSAAEHILVSGAQPIARDIRWRPSSKALLYTRINTVGPSPELSDLAVHEVTIDGRDRAVRAIPREVLSIGKSPTEIRLGDSLAISVGSAGVWAVPYDGGAARLLKRGTTTRTTFTPDGRAIVHGLETNRDVSFKVLEVLGVDGTVMRNIRLPFDGYTTSNDRHIVLTPDGREAIIVGRDSAAAVAKIYRVPLDGSVARAIVTLQNRSPSQIDVTSDGRSILYTEVGPETSSFVLVDLTAELARMLPRH